ncbi:MAG: hypothetical protein COB36_10515 [Alphaproteobacteria bacterium]|nr:MAG: hypothetical protein COB36_10515 [Alphaproteobacteria bacterium]
MTATHLNFGDYLEHKYRTSPAKRKGERTRDRLEISAVRVLENKGYHDIRVADICEQADVSTATFYLYFENKTEITVAVLKNFTEQIISNRSQEKNENNAFSAIYNSNLSWVRQVRANAGLSRCLLQLQDQEGEFSQYFQRISYSWYKYVVKTTSKYITITTENNPVFLLATYAMGGMIDEIVRSQLVYPNPHLLSVLDEVAPSDENLAEFLSLLWYRSVFGTDPDLALLSYDCTKKLLAVKGPPSN